jgi:predicted amidohydrolase
MQDLKVTLVQTEQFWKDKSSNLSNYDALLEQIESTDLILLPEMFHTGFCMDALELAESPIDSQGINWLKQKSYKLNAAIYTSIIVEVNNSFFNRGVFVFPTGEMTCYDKVHLFSLAGEDQVFSPGEERAIVSYNGWKIALQICYDLRFPELARNRIDMNGNPDYDVLLYVANWPERRILHWDALLKARAIENQSFVVAVNRVGTDGTGLTYNGSSAVYDALGNSILKAIDFESKAISCVLNWDSLLDVRTKIPFLKDQK